MPGSARPSWIGAVDVLHDVAVERARVEDAAVEHTADELDVIERLHGHHIPETGAECGVGVAVVVFPAARAVVGQAGAVGWNDEYRYPW